MINLRVIIEKYLEKWEQETDNHSIRNDQVRKCKGLIDKVSIEVCEQLELKSERVSISRKMK